MGYVSALNSIGESIVSWADPDGAFGGYTEVSRRLAVSTFMVNSNASNNLYKISTGMAPHRLCQRL